MPQFRSNKFFAFLVWMAKRLGPLRLHGHGLPEMTIDGFSNQDLIGYPNNQNYIVDDGRLIPHFNLYWRWQILSQLYSEPVETLLDIGSAKGWFVLDAVQRADCERALGIDVYEPWVDLSNRVATKLHHSNATFRLAFLRDVFNRPEAFGAPFKNVLIVNAYHYLFWGSGISPSHFTSHAEILEGLYRITTDRVIFANPLEMMRVPKETRKIAAADPGRRIQYTSEHFLAAAAKYFDVTNHRSLGNRRLLVLRPKHRPA